jgi:hypothetical protein
LIQATKRTKLRVYIRGRVLFYHEKGPGFNYQQNKIKWRDLSLRRENKNKKPKNLKG